MTTIAEQERVDFHSVLSASSRAPEIPEDADIYGWLIGGWELDVIHYWTDVRALNLKGEAHFLRILEGRAVLDVWIMPRRADRSTNLGKTNNTYGTTLRVWDSALQAWRVTWINPVTGNRNELVGRKVGADVVQIGTHPNGTPIRWSFTEITAHSFLWSGESLDPDGKTWKLEGQFRARRMR